MSELVLAEVVEVAAFSEGQRVLLDFMEAFDENSYILVGNTFHGMIAVASENHDTPNYKPRRFRFNIGSLHQYVLVDDERLCYVDELGSGDKVLIGNNRCGCENFSRNLVIARVKREVRPFVKISCKHEGLTFSAVLQADATTALLTEKGIILLSDVQPGNKIYAFPWGQASHLGNSKDEWCEEM